MFDCGLGLIMLVLIDISEVAV